MNTKMSLTTLIAAATLAIGGVAIAQPTSTAGAGCTATANAMRGGNLGSSPSDIACTTAGGAKNAAAPVAAAATPVAAPAAAPVTTTTTTTSTAVASDTGNSGAAPVRMARAPRADRN